MQEDLGLIIKKGTVKIPKEYDNLPLGELIEKGIIEKYKTEYCEVHSKNYTSTPYFKTGLCGVLYSECPECARDRETKRQQEEKEKQEAIKRAQIEREESILRARGCGKKFLKLRGSLKTDIELWESGKLEGYLKHNGSDFENKDNLIILGGVGVGKTFFACKLVETAYKLGLKYILLNSFELVSIYKNKSIAGFNRTNSFENIAEFLEDVDCVILDEVDYFLRGSKDIRDDEALHHFSQICEKEDVRVIILGNCNRKELKESMPPKIYSRFAGGKVVGGWNMKDMRVKQ